MAYVHLIAKALVGTAHTEIVQKIYDMTGGVFGKPDAMREGEKIDNCIPGACGGGLVVGGYQYYRIVIKDKYLDGWTAGDYGSFEIMDFPAYVEEEITIPTVTGQVEREVITQEWTGEFAKDGEPITREVVTTVVEDVVEDIGTGEYRTVTNAKTPYNCGTVTYTDEDGVERSHDVMMGW